MFRYRDVLPADPGRVAGVVRAGPKFELLAVNDMGDLCMACPAISRGALFVRTQHALFALGQTPAAR